MTPMVPVSQTKIRVFRIETSSDHNDQLEKVLIALICDHDVECMAFFVRRSFPVFSRLTFMPLAFLDRLSRLLYSKITPTNAARIVKLSLAEHLDSIYYQERCCLVWPISRSVAYIAHPLISEATIRRHGISVSDEGDIDTFARDQFI